MTMVRRFRATNGREGLPVFMAGERIMRVSKLELAKYVAGRFHGGEAPAPS
jgi:hypothetical protein